MRRDLRFSTLAILAMLAWLPSCSRESTTETSQERSFDVEGRIHEIDLTNSMLVIEHEDIPGFMPAMTMPFNLGTGEKTDGLAAGDAVKFQFVVGANESWIRDLEKIDPSRLDLPAKKPTPAPTSSGSNRVKEGDSMPEFHLIDQKGRAICNCAFAGKSVVLTFIFTRCPVPDFCPRMSNRFSELEKLVKKDATLAGRTNLLSISIDPEFDTPKVLADYSAVHTRDGDFWRFTTGDVDQIGKLTRAFAVYTETANGTINHGLCTALVGPDGVIRRIWRGNAWQSAEILEALKEIETPADTPSPTENSH